MQSLWNKKTAPKKNPLDLLVYRSRLIGSEPKLCVWGGGNTSSKMTETDHLGRKMRVLRVKGSGSDLKSCKGPDFSPLRLDDVMPTLKRKTMTDQDMVDYLQKCLLNPKAPRPSIEALLHAFLPYQAIDHTHADAILSLTNTSKPREICKKVFGDDYVFIPYVKPGFDLAKKVAREVAKHPKAKGVILEKHGFITWGEDSKTSYERTIQGVTKAEQYIKKMAAKKKAFGGPKVKTASKKVQDAFLDTYLPAIRKAVSGDKRFILHFNGSSEVLEFASSKYAPVVSQVGPATPDHMLRTKRIPCLLQLAADPLKTSKESIAKQIASYAKAHERYYNQYKSNGTYMLNPFPAVILIPGIGLLATGKDLQSALIVSEIYEHSISVMRAASFIDSYASLSRVKAFEIEYWPMELYKLSLAPPEKELARHVALVTGACGGIGRGVSKSLASAGAQVVVTDMNAESAKALAEEINTETKSKRAIGLRLDVTNEKSISDVFLTVKKIYGGLDIVVSNAGVATVASIETLPRSEWERNFSVNATGHFLVAREAFKWMRDQGLGGSFVFMATKNVPAPGAEFGAYSASKAACAQLAKIIAIEGGPFGIRSNMVNPDGVFNGSGLWAGIKKSRAKSHGISSKALEEHYRNRNLLQKRVEPSDVGEAVLFLASERARLTTGTMLPVDGGLREAFPR